MTTLGAFPDLRTGETDVRSCDYRPRLFAGETVTAATVTCTAQEGEDESAANLPIGEPQIAGNVVTQLLGPASGGGVAGVRYELLFEAETSIGRVLVETGALTLVAASPPPAP